MSGKRKAGGRKRAGGSKKRVEPSAGRDGGPPPGPRGRRRAMSIATGAEDRPDAEVVDVPPVPEDFVLNGFLVVHRPAPKETPYRGPDGLPWPVLDGGSAPRTHRAHLRASLTGAHREGEADVSTDLQAALDHRAECRRQRIPTDLLILRSPVPSPALEEGVLEDLDVDPGWGGFDLCTPFWGDVSSVILSDLLLKDVPVLGNFRHVLNAHGLLPDLETTLAFRDARAARLDEGCDDIDDVGEVVPIHVTRAAED